MAEQLIAELNKIGTNKNGIAVATDIFNYLTMGENMDDSKAVKIVANLFVNRDNAKILAIHDKALNWNKFLGKKYV